MKKTHYLFASALLAVAMLLTVSCGGNDDDLAGGPGSVVPEGTTDPSAIEGLMGENTIPVSSFSVNWPEKDGSITIEEDEELAITANVQPDNATEQLSWKVEDDSPYLGVLALDNTGRQATVKGMNVDGTTRTARLVVKAQNGMTESHDIYIKKKTIPVSFVFLPFANTVKAGDRITVSAVYTPANATVDPAKFIWSISDNTIAEITGNGTECVIRGLKEGTTTVRCKYGISVHNMNLTVTSSYVFVSSIAATPSNVKVELGKTFSVTGTIAPTNATFKALRWTVSDSEALEMYSHDATTLDYEDKLTFKANKIGNYTITAASTNGSASTVINVQVVRPTPPPGTVDLGITSVSGAPVFYATCNLGANSPSAYGDYYSWGELNPYYTNLYPIIWKSEKKAGYVPANNRFHVNKNGVEQYAAYGLADGVSTLRNSDDPVYYRMGKNWHMPDYFDMFYLLMYCNITEEQLNGVYGVRFTSKVDGFRGNSIFLPYSGYFAGTVHLGHSDFKDQKGNPLRVMNYWTSTANVNNYNVYEFFYNSSGFGTRESKSRANGCPIRPVYCER